MGKRLQAFASSARFNVHGNTAYGFENDIFFNVDWVKYYGVEGAFVTVTMFLKQLDTSVFTEFKKFIKDNKKRFRANNVSLNDGGITAVLNAGATRIKPEMVLTFMRETAVFFRARVLFRRVHSVTKQKVWNISNKTDGYYLSAPHAAKDLSA